MDPDIWIHRGTSQTLVAAVVPTHPQARVRSAERPWLQLRRPHPSARQGALYHLRVAAVCLSLLQLNVALLQFLLATMMGMIFTSATKSKRSTHRAWVQGFITLQSSLQWIPNMLISPSSSMCCQLVNGRSRTHLDSLGVTKPRNHQYTISCRSGRLAGECVIRCFATATCYAREPID